MENSVSERSEIVTLSSMYGSHRNHTFEVPPGTQGAERKKVLNQHCAAVENGRQTKDLRSGVNHVQNGASTTQWKTVSSKDTRYSQIPASID